MNPSGWPSKIKAGPIASECTSELSEQWKSRPRYQTKNGPLCGPFSIAYSKVANLQGGEGHQTSVGLLASVDANAEDRFLAVVAEEGLALQSTGQVVKDGAGALVEISWTRKNLSTGETSQPLRMYIPEDPAQ